MTPPLDSEACSDGSGRLTWFVPVDVSLERREVNPVRTASVHNPGPELTRSPASGPPGGVAPAEPAVRADEPLAAPRCVTA